MGQKLGQIIHFSAFWPKNSGFSGFSFVKCKFQGARADFDRAQPGQIPRRVGGWVARQRESLPGAAASPGKPERAKVATAAGLDAAAGGQTGGNSWARATRRPRNCGTQGAGRLERGAREREPPANNSALFSEISPPCEIDN